MSSFSSRDYHWPIRHCENHSLSLPLSPLSLSFLFLLNRRERSPLIMPEKKIILRLLNYSKYRTMRIASPSLSYLTQILFKIGLEETNNPSTSLSTGPSHSISSSCCCNIHSNPFDKIWSRGDPTIQRNSHRKRKANKTAWRRIEWLENANSSFREGEERSHWDKR